MEHTYKGVDLIDADDDDVEDFSIEMVLGVGSVPSNENYEPKDEEDQAKEINKNMVVE